MTTEADQRHRTLEVIDVWFEGSALMARTPDGRAGALNVDHTYQRSLDQRHVEALRQDWDSIAADPVTLSRRRDGSLWIVNGQHEIAAAILEGETELFAWIYDGLTVSREADIRLKKNNSRSDTALEKFHSRLTKEKEGPGIATAIVALLDDFGTYVNKSNSKYSGVNCVGTLERLYKRDDGVILRWTLRALKDAYGELQGEVVVSPRIEGLAWFLTAHYGEYSRKQLLERMRREGPAGLTDLAHGFKRVFGRADWVNQYLALVEVYNRKRKDENRLEPKTTRWTSEQPGGAFGRTGQETRQRDTRKKTAA